MYAILLVYLKETYCVEPEFGEWCIIKLKEPFANGDFANISAALFLIPLSGSCVSIRVLKHNSEIVVSTYHFSLLTKKDISRACVKDSGNLAGFCIILLVFSLFFASRCRIGCIISKTEIQQ